MSQNNLPTVYQMRPDPADADADIYDAEVIEVRPHRAETRTAHHSDQFVQRLIRVLLRLAFGPFEYAISGFWKPDPYPTYPEHNPPRGPAGGAPYSPGYSGGASGPSGAQASDGFGANHREMWCDDGRVFAGKTDRGYWYFGLIGLPSFVKRVVVILVIILLLVAVGLYNIPELGVGNFLDLMFAFH